MRPTMKDVARAAGVSLMTVSRVVAGEAGVAPETAAKVEGAIRALGYQRNDIARNLRRKGQDSRTIGLVVDDLANPFFSVLARSVEDEAYRRGSLVLVGSTNDEPRRERDVVAAFCSRQVDGLIMVPTGGNQVFLRAQMNRGVKVVAVDRPVVGLDVDSVTVDNRAGAERAVRHLIAHGHRRIAYLGDRQEIWTQGERYAGYLAALDAQGIPVDPELVRHGLRGREEAAAALGDLMAGAEPPTALFSGNDLVTIGVVDAGGADRFALVGFDDFPLSDKLDPPVTVVSQDPAALGRTAAQLLFGRIDGDDSAPRSVVLLTRFLERGSGEVEVGEVQRVGRE
jgi:DNA-binding LacI/PurR family transcriptional regulator